MRSSMILVQDRACAPTVTMLADSDLSTSGLMSEYCVEDRPGQKGRMRMIAFRGFGLPFGAALKLKVKI